jgi:phage terminase large subunit-like protein
MATDPLALRDRALDFMATLVLEDGRCWGEAAEPFQWRSAVAMLDPTSRTPYLYETRPRGGAKTADGAAVLTAVIGTQAPPGARLYALAADRDQGALILDSIRGFADRTPGLRGLLDISAYRVSLPGTGVRLEILSADAPSSWGIRPYFLIVDELAQWPETPNAKKLFEAVRSAAGKVNGRMTILTTPGDPTHFAYGVLQHAQRDPLWRVHEIHGPVPWIDPERLDEQRRALPESSYQRLHLGRWAAAEDRLTTLDDLAACATLDGPLAPRPGVSYVIGADLGITHDRTALAVCHAEATYADTTHREIIGHRVFVDRVHCWKGSRDNPVQVAAVRDALLTSSHSYNGARLVIDPYQAIGVAQDLRRTGVRVEEFPFTVASNGRLANTLHLLLRSRTISLQDDPDLIEELARVRLCEAAPGVLRLDHDPDQHDDRAIAIALAATYLLEHASDAGPRVRTLCGPPPPRRFGGLRIGRW